MSNFSRIAVFEFLWNNVNMCYSYATPTVLSNFVEKISWTLLNLQNLKDLWNDNAKMQALLAK